MSNEENNENNTLKNVRLKNSDKVIIGHININSLRHNFYLLPEIFQNKVGLLMISKTKLNFLFPVAQFYIKSYSKPNRLDKKSKVGGLTLQVKEEIPSKLINLSWINHEKKNFFLEILKNKNGW